MRASKKAKKYLQDLQTLKGVGARKKQQVEDALKLVTGLQKGIDTTRLLSGIQEDRQNQKTLTQEETAAASATGALPAGGKAQKGDTNRASLRLYKEGIPITEIAIQRGLTLNTVESHLASFIPTGEIDVKDLVPAHKIDPILSAIRTIGGTSLGPIKSKLGEDYSFGEIRAVLTWSRLPPSGT
jgi:hypothetical protein